MKIIDASLCLQNFIIRFHEDVDYFTNEMVIYESANNNITCVLTSNEISIAGKRKRIQRKEKYEGCGLNLCNSMKIKYQQMD